VIEGSVSRRAVALALAGVVGLCSSPAFAASNSAQLPALPAARVKSLTPRVLDLRPRIVDLAPRQTRHGPTTSFIVGTDVLFAFGSATPSPDARAVLGQVVQRLRRARGGTVKIDGYTDSIGTVSFHLGLSRRRAASVQAYLTANVDNPRLHYRSVGLGEADPVAPNTRPDGSDNPDGRRQNRRVVISEP